MRTFIALILTLITISFFTSSCEKTQSFADKVKAEKKAIERLKSDSGFVFTKEYPKNGVFGPKVFYQDPATGAYYNVVDSGNGKRAVPGKTEILIRYKNTFFFGGSTIIDSTNMGVGYEAPESIIDFQFVGRTGVYQAPSTQPLKFYLLSPGLASPLFRVGQNAVVRLIIPFSAGSAYQTSIGFEPVFMGYVKYRFDPRTVQ